MIETETIIADYRARNADGSLKRDRKGGSQKSKTEYRIGRYFIGRVRNGRRPNQIGLWERRRGNQSVRMIAEFVRIQRYTHRLGPYEEWKERYDEICCDYFYRGLYI